MQPLSHHEILDWVEPFTRRGRAVDLAGSDRLARQLAFKPLARDEAGLPPLQETLTLDNPGPGLFRLTRRLVLPVGLVAQLQAEGAQPGALLAQVEALPAQRQIGVGRGWTLALQQRLAGAGGEPELLEARARLDGVELRLTMPGMRGVPAGFTLASTVGETIVLPEDLLAVLGWDWTRLEARNDGWHGQLRLHGRGAGRSARAEHQLVQTLEHLARTLAEPPAAFHDRHRLARWGVLLRRAIPLAVCLGLIAAAAAVPRLTLADDSVLRMLILNAPPLLLIGFFCLREIPRIEVPPLPRRLQAPGWFQAPRTTVSVPHHEANDACSATR